MNYYKINTYKSVWYEDKLTGNYWRQQKEKYFLEPIINSIKPVLKHIPKINNLIGLLGKKEQGHDFYRYYERIIKQGSRGSWAEEYKAIVERFNKINIYFDDKFVLDISGEPGFFAADLQQVCRKVIVTGLTDNVVNAMKEYLHLDAKIFDFNANYLPNSININEEGIMDFIFARYCIGFCVNLDDFFSSIRYLLKLNGFFYVSFSPASRGVCARWMFDDYTYLKQYTIKTIQDKASNYGLELSMKWDDGCYRWDKDLNVLAKLISHLYQKNNFFKENKFYEMQQHNTALLFKKVE